MPKAMEVVGIQTNCSWECRMICWIDAYHTSLTAKDTQKHLKDFSSRKYASQWMCYRGSLIVR
jgi:hypothetical protein